MNSDMQMVMDVALIALVIVAVIFVISLMVLVFRVARTVKDINKIVEANEPNINETLSNVKEISGDLEVVTDCVSTTVKKSEEAIQNASSAFKGFSKISNLFGRKEERNDR